MRTFFRFFDGRVAQSNAIKLAPTTGTSLHYSSSIICTAGTRLPRRTAILSRVPDVPEVCSSTEMSTGTVRYGTVHVYLALVPGTGTVPVHTELNCTAAVRTTTVLFRAVSLKSI